MAIEEKPSRNEDEYFLKLDQELIKAQRARRDAERAEMERRQHFMKCPKCGYDLQERDMGGIKIDECTNCRGVFLDAGEIELLKRADRAGVGNLFGSLFGRKK
jgi:uncharacterized protein